MSVFWNHKHNDHVVWSVLFGRGVSQTENVLMLCIGLFSLFNESDLPVHVQLKIKLDLEFFVQYVVNIVWFSLQITQTILCGISTQ